MSRWTVRPGDVPAGADALVLLSVEELAVNELRETFHHWVRTLVFPGQQRQRSASRSPTVPAVDCGLRSTHDAVDHDDRARGTSSTTSRRTSRRSSTEHAARLTADAAHAQLETAGAEARQQEDERYRSRQGEVSSLIAENTLASSSAKSTSSRSSASRVCCSTRRRGSTSSTAPSRRSRRRSRAAQRHYEEVRDQLERERERILKHLLPKRHAMAGAAQVFPVAVEVRLPGGAHERRHELTGWDRLRHGGLLLDPPRLRRLAARSSRRAFRRSSRTELRRADRWLLDGTHAEMSEFVAFVLEKVCGFSAERRRLAARLAGRRRVGTARGHRRDGQAAAALAWARTAPSCRSSSTTKPRLGIGRGRKAVSQALQWLRAGNERLALLTNGRQWRLIFAGLDFDAWCEWDVDLWFEEGALSPQVDALRTLLSPGALDAAAPKAPCPAPRRPSSTAARGRPSCRPCSASASARPSSCSSRRTARR